MAADRSSALTLPIIAIGRLRDARSHEFLRTLLRTELAEGDHKKTRPRISALINGLSDYADPTDASLLAQAVGRDLDSAGVWEAEEVGETGSPDAIPLLQEVFARRGHGWAVMGAGLGLARCGSAIGTEYVRERLADIHGAQYPDGEPANGVTDDPNGPRATSYILEHLGVSADEPFVPTLLDIASSALYSDHARTLAWNALLRIHSSKYRPQAIEAAWTNLTFDGAVRLLALDDPSGAEKRLSAAERDKASFRTQGLAELRRALAATDREKRRWRETRGYGF